MIEFVGREAEAVMTWSGLTGAFEAGHLLAKPEIADLFLYRDRDVMLDRAVPAGAVLVTLDERGKLMSSPEFAAMLARWRDGGRQDVAFVIGGADGIDPILRAKADASISFGAMVWPHMLVRVMIAEQLYRAATILGGGPYHRA